MRISDWSSDVCSSDLAPELWPLHRHPGEGGRDNRAPVQGAGGRRRHAGGRPTLSPWRGGRGAPRAGGPPHPRLHHPPAGRATMTDFRLGSLVAEVAGDGPAVVMVHGLGGSSNSFQDRKSTRLKL